MKSHLPWCGHVSPQRWPAGDVDPLVIWRERDQYLILFEKGEDGNVVQVVVVVFSVEVEEFRILISEHHYYPSVIDGT